MGFSLNTPGRCRRAFTLVEILVSLGVLTFIIIFVTQLVNNTTTVTTSSSKHMDADSQARLLLDRMATDFALMVKRSDVDIFLKIKHADANPEPGNDQIAFFSEVPGYSSGSASSVSLVSYRVNSNFQVERLGKGLLWNGASSVESSMVFLPMTIAATWPTATTATGTDSDYEKISLGVFRVEYYYLLKSGAYSATPWDTSQSTAINGLRDVAAIGVTIAVVDLKSRVLVTNDQLTVLAGQMEDFADGMTPGAMETQWRRTINASSIPRAAASSIQIYQRLFYLATSPP